MKALLFLWIFFASAAWAEKIEFYCNGSRSILGSKLSVETPGLLNNGAAIYKNPLPSEFQLTGKEQIVSTEGVEQALSPLGDVSRAQGYEYLKGASRKFIPLESRSRGADAATEQKIFIEEDLVRYGKNSGVIVFALTGKSASQSQIEKTVEIASCSRVKL